MRHTVIGRIVITGCFFLALCAGGLPAADSSQHPVTAEYCDDTTLAVYPVSRVTRDDGSVFICSEVQVTPVSGGLRYGFEDKDDADYNDIIVELRITGQGSGSPVVQVTFVSKDASFGHEVHLRFNNNDVTVFNGDDHTPGSVFSVPLPERECPDFSVSASPSNLSLPAGESVDFTVTLETTGGYTGTVNLECPGLPMGIKATFAPASISPGLVSQLTFSTAQDLAAGTYNIVIRGDDGERVRTTTVQLVVRIAGDFTLSADPEVRILTPGAVTEYSISLRTTGGHERPVALDCPNPPEGVTVSFEPDTIAAETVSRMLTTTADDLPSGTYRMTIRGDDGNHEKSITVGLEIRNPTVHLNKAFNQSHARPGEKVRMELAVTNRTGAHITRLTLSDELPTGMQYLEDNAPVPVQRDGRILSWTLPRLNMGATRRFFVDLRLAPDIPAGRLLNTVKAWAAAHDSPIAEARAELSVEVFELGITKTVNLSQAAPGDELSYQLEVTNGSSVALDAVEVRDELPPQLTFISVGGPWQAEREGRRLTWKGRLAPEESLSLSVRTRIPAATRGGTIIRNSARVSAPELDKAVESNTVQTTITGSAAKPGSIRFTKRAPIPQTEVGRIIRFVLEVDNRSSSPLVDLFIEDPLPQGFAYVPGSAILNGRVLEDPAAINRPGWTLPTLASKDSLRLVFQTVIAADARRGRHVNRARLRARDTLGGIIELEAETLVYVSAGGLVFLTGIEGTVFLDRDGDGFQSPGDTPLEGIAVRLSTGEETASGRDGTYKLEGLTPGEYAVSVNPAALPERFRRGDSMPRLVVLSDGLTETIDFPLRFRGEDENPLTRLEGRVFLDRDGNGTFDAGDTLLQSFRARLDDQVETAGENGRFVFSRIEPGRHLITIEAPGIRYQREAELPPGSTTLDIPLEFSGLIITVREEK